MSASHRRHDLSDRVWDRLKAHLPGAEGKVRQASLRQPAVLEWGILDIAHWCALAGPAPGLGGLEEHPSTFLALAGPGRLGQAAG